MMSKNPVQIDVTPLTDTYLSFIFSYSRWRVIALLVFEKLNNHLREFVYIWFLMHRSVQGAGNIGQMYIPTSVDQVQDDKLLQTIDNIVVLYR